MNNVRLLAMMASLAAMAACTSDDDIMNTYTDSFTSYGSSAVTGKLSTFDVAVDKTTSEPASAAEEYFPEEEDALENNEFTTEVSIDMSAPADKTENGVQISVTDGHVVADHGTTKKVCYVVSGTTANGSLTILGEKKYAVKLNGVNITNPDSAALNLLSSKRAFVILADGTANTLTDGTSSQNDHKGALYCKGKLLFNGSGALAVYGNYNNGIHSADYIVLRNGNNIYVKSTANHGVKANDGVFINGGILNVEVSAAAAKGINCESDIIVNGGRTTVLTTGGGAYDTEEYEAKGSAGIKSDGALTVNGGELWLKSTGSGGKGISVDTEACFNGGSVYIVTTGGQYRSNNDTASPKGVKTDGNITVTARAAKWPRMPTTTQSIQQAIRPSAEAASMHTDETTTAWTPTATATSRAASSMPYAPDSRKWPSMPTPRADTDCTSRAAHLLPWEDWRAVHSSHRLAIRPHRGRQTHGTE